MAEGNVVAELTVMIRGQINDLKAKLNEARQASKQASGQVADDVDKGSKKVGDSLQKNVQKQVDITNQKIKQMASESTAALEHLGRSLTTSVSLPLAGIAVESARLAMSFDDAMAKIQGLAGASAAATAAYRERIMNLATATGRMPQELADGMFIVVSAGLKGAQAMDVLTTSAKLAASGMGDTKTVADAITSSMNAYGTSTYKSSQIADMFTAAVTQGKMPTEALAGSIGRVLGVSARLHVGLDQVLASIALMTREGLNADEATTALRATLGELLKPAASTKKALAAIGLTAAQVRDDLKENMIGTLQMLSKELKGNDEAMTRIFPNIRALTGVLAMTGAQANELKVILSKIRYSAGDTAHSFKVSSETIGFAWKSAMADLSTAGIQMGDALAPQVKRVTDAAKSLADWFKSLSDRDKSLVVDVGALVASIGPLIVIVGSTIRNLAALSAITTGLSARLGLLKVSTVETTATFEAASLEMNSFSAAMVAAKGVAASFAGVLTGVLAVAAGAATVKIVQLYNAIQDEDAAVQRRDLSENNQQAAFNADTVGAAAYRYAINKGAKGSRIDVLEHQWLKQKGLLGIPSRTGLEEAEANPQFYRDAFSASIKSGQAKMAREKAKQDAGDKPTYTGGAALPGSEKKHRAKETEAQKEAKTAMEEYKREVQSLTLALHSEGKTEDWQLAIVERKYGKYKDLTNAEWQRVYSLISQKERVEQLASAQQAAADKAKQSAEQAKLLVEENTRAQADYLASQQRELATIGLTTNAEKTLYEVREGSLKNASDWTKQLALAQAKLLDQKEHEIEVDKELAKAATQKGQSIWTPVFKTVVDVVTKEQTKEARDFATYMGRINAETIRQSSLSVEAKARLDALSQSWGKNADMVKQAVAAVVQRTQWQEFQAQAQKAADGLTAVFTRSVEGLNQGFKGFFSNLVGGFDRSLAQMAMKWAQSQLTQGIFKMLGGTGGMGGFGGSLSSFGAIGGGIGGFGALGAAGGILGSIFGGGHGSSGPSGQTLNLGSALGSLFGGFKASGGPVLSSQAYVVGEKGPELFIPPSNGSIVPNGGTATSGASSAGGTTVSVTMNVTATDASSFLRSTAQIAGQLGQAIQSATQRNR